MTPLFLYVTTQGVVAETSAASIAATCVVEERLSGFQRNAKYLCTILSTQLNRHYRQVGAGELNVFIECNGFVLDPAVGCPRLQLHRENPVWITTISRQEFEKEQGVKDAEVIVGG